jgi:hypothetical protein
VVLTLGVLLAGALLGPSIAFVSDPGDERFGTVVLTGVPSSSDWSRAFTVHVQDGDPDAPPVLGDYIVERDSVRFRPRFAFVPGLTYRARFEETEIVFTMPARDPGERPRVLAVFPSASEVPSNLLRLYVQFSRPMWAKDASKKIHLLDADGREVPVPFVEVESGLWDSGGERLTLFFHPGRLKRGVGPNLALGPPLLEGGLYRLVIDREIRDERGVELEARFERELRVGPADRTSPDPSRWALSVRDRSSPLEVSLDEPLDRALLLRLLRVETASGDEVPGVPSVSGNETRFTFTPELPWPPGEYRLRVDAEIEDLAGNKPGRLFEEPAENAASPRAFVMPFEVR